MFMRRENKWWLGWNTDYTYHSKALSMEDKMAAGLGALRIMGETAVLWPWIASHQQQKQSNNNIAIICGFGFGAFARFSSSNCLEMQVVYWWRHTYLFLKRFFFKLIVRATYLNKTLHAKTKWLLSLNSWDMGLLRYFFHMKLLFTHNKL